MSGARSTTGCWTCRLRKKKCDEQHPNCLNCSSRGIHCYGYGPAPFWMDGGGLEAEQVKKIKRAAAENYKARRNRWKVASLERSNGAPVLHDPDRIVKRNQGPESRELVMRQHYLDGVSLVSSDFSSGSSPSQFQGDQISGTGGIAGVGLPRSPESSPGSKLGLFSDPQPPSSTAMDQIWWDCGLTNTHNIRSTQELFAMMHYLDNVFPLQYGFYRSSSAAIGRGWLLNAFLRSKPLYYGSLSLSVHHQSLQRSGNLNSPGNLSWNAENIYALTLKDLQLQVASLQYITGPELIEKRFDVLGSMNQVLSVEVFRHLGGHWDVHLQAARRFLLAIGSNKCNSMRVHGPRLNPNRLDKLEKILRSERNSVLPSSAVLAMKFFVTCFIWVDVLSFASGFETFDANHIDYVELLEDNILQLEKLMGCENWVMIIMLKIALLEGLKKRELLCDERIRHYLMTQAVRLELSLNRGLSRLLEVRNTLAGLDRDSNVVTEIFACAAITYLQVVVFGAHPEEPEIRGSVTRTLKALSVLPNRLLLRISWPFCITGCMAIPEEEHIFPDMISKANTAGEIIGTLWKAQRVMEEVWRIRKINAEVEVDWKAAMESLGLKVLLV